MIISLQIPASYLLLSNYDKLRHTNFDVTHRTSVYLVSVVNRTRSSKQRVGKFVLALKTKRVSVLHLCKHRVRQNVGTHVIIHKVIYNSLLAKASNGDSMKHLVVW